MRVLVLLVWLMIPVGVGLYHFGPGQEQLRIDVVDHYTRSAEQAVEGEDWAAAESHYAAALEMLPADQVAQQQRLTLELAKVQMHNKKLSTAHQTLKSLVSELTNDAQADSELLSESRSALANSQYYMTWLMRLEGHPRERWEPEVESARQTYALLAEQAEEDGDANQATKCKEDLESAIRLARMDLSDLQGLPLPQPVTGHVIRQRKRSRSRPKPEEVPRS